MKNIICAALIGIAAIGVASSANAAVGISFNFGDVALAYSDGYYDSHHHWHHWRSGERDRYRHDHPSHYSNWGHNDHHHGHH